MIFGKVSSRALSSQFLKPFLLLNMVRPFGDGEDTTDGDIDDDDVHINDENHYLMTMTYILKVGLELVHCCTTFLWDLGCEIKRIPKDIDSYDDGDK